MERVVTALFAVTTPPPLGVSLPCCHHRNLLRRHPSPQSALLLCVVASGHLRVYPRCGRLHPLLLGHIYAIPSNPPRLVGTTWPCLNSPHFLAFALEAGSLSHYPLRLTSPRPLPSGIILVHFIVSLRAMIPPCFLIYVSISHLLCTSYAASPSPFLSCLLTSRLRPSSASSPFASPSPLPFSLALLSSTLFLSLSLSCSSKLLSSHTPSSHQPLLILSAPFPHPLCTISAPSLHPFRTLSAPSLHPLCTLSVPSLHPHLILSEPSLYPFRFLSAPSPHTLPSLSSPSLHTLSTLASFSLHPFRTLFTHHPHPRVTLFSAAPVSLLSVSSPPPLLLLLSSFSPSLLTLFAPSPFVSISHSSHLLFALFSPHPVLFRPAFLFRSASPTALSFSPSRPALLPAAHAPDTRSRSRGQRSGGDGGFVRPLNRVITARTGRGAHAPPGV